MLSPSDMAAIRDMKIRWLGRAASALVSVGVLSWLLAPRGPEADYAGTGLLLALGNYGLIVPLVGFGAAVAGLGGLLIAEAMALFAAGLASAAAVSETVLLHHQDVLAFVVRYPVTNCALALVAGLALLVGGRMRGIPFAALSLVLGAALGTTIGLYSPGDDQAMWFVAPAAMSGAAVVLVAAFVLAKIEGPWWSVARNILGSWLVATGVLLAGFPLVPKKNAAPPPQAEAREPSSQAGSVAIEKTSPHVPQLQGFDPARQP